jgi:GT2 family glycosyltransferase/SAM-dependent methyltransferase
MKTFPDDFFCEDGVWYHRGHDYIDYSDGAASENYLAQVFSRAGNLRSDSLGLLEHIRDWPSQYHLSPLRANLLRFLPLPSGARVLELGSGCGALTRYLGETLPSVIAVEGSRSRAALTRRRCQDLPQVTVLAANFQDLHFSEPFHLVTLIGVLEYAALYGQGSGDPFLHLLHAAHNHLTDHGVLILAIENQLGLKYFAGAPEDHLGRPFVGLEGYSDHRTPRTFGRLELLRLLNRAGFQDYQLLLPFPDYKLPTVVVNAALASAEAASAYNLADWCRQPSEDHYQERRYLFNEHLALAQVAANGLLADHAPSFLVLAYKQPLSQKSMIPPLPWVCQKLNILRHPRFRTRTVLVDADNAPAVLKERLSDTPEDLHLPFAQVLQTRADYLTRSSSLAFSMLQALHATSSAEESFMALLRRWHEFLLGRQLPDGCLPPWLLDCIPENLLVDDQNVLHYIDAEWHWAEPIALLWVLLRGLRNFWERYLPWLKRLSWPGPIADRDFFAHCLARLKVPCSLEEMHRWLEQESEFQHQVVYGASRAPGAASPAPPAAEPAPAGQPPVSIIIPVYNNLELTQNCLESIRRHTPPELYELIVVDNASTDGTGRFLKQLSQEARLCLISNPANLGFARASNQGAVAARGQFLLFLNNDTLPTPGWLEELLRGVTDSPQVAAVGAKLLYPDDTVQHAGVVFSERGAVYHLYRHFHRDHPAVNKERDFQVVTGACLLMRREVFFQAGQFDETFQNGFEDVDLCLKVRDLGYRIRYIPGAVVYHLESKTAGRFAREADNARYLAAKWQGRLVPDDLRYYREDGLQLVWTVNAAGKREAVIHDANGNHFKEQARAHLERGELAQALAFYEEALRFNPFDPRNRGLLAELETVRLAAATLAAGGPA